VPIKMGIQSDRWAALEWHRQEMESVHMRSLFRRDPHRSQRYTAECAGLILDYSKQRVTDETLQLLITFADECGLEQQRDRMFAGAHINTSEDRPVLHTALRDQSGQALIVDGVDVAAEINQELRRLIAFSDAVRTGEIRGRQGLPFTDVINIGIGGSDLGPKMVCHALANRIPGGLTPHFLSNPDSSEVFAVLRGLDPTRTLCVVSSKTFTTQETLTNAATVRKWLRDALGSDDAAMKQFIAVTARPQMAATLGYAPERSFRFWDWVGGRYSLWSAIGLPIMLTIGSEAFTQLLAGAYAMDQHFRTAPLAHNIPALLALLGLWSGNFLKASSHLIAAYDARLRYLPAYVQQLDMESNGKRTTAAGDPISHSTGPVIWGDLGINGQHAFFQLVHQGMHLVPVDFIGVLNVPGSLVEHQRIVHANMLAQAEALMMGRTIEETRTELHAAGVDESRILSLTAQRSFGGNVPSNMLLLEALTPYTLGALIAMYEHKVFAQGVLWGINSFDQWGVELGKQLGHAIFGELCGKPETTEHDASTTRLIQRVSAALNQHPDATP
jgi:glucose-6-phosphate isomerase